MDGSSPTIDTDNYVCTTNILNVECKVAVTLWRLATHLEYRSIGVIFKMCIRCKTISLILHL